MSVHFEKILDRDLRFLEKVIKVCIELKISVVSKDEKEAGLRKILNFGHTYAHALEKITDYKKFTHGMAVSYGMYFMFNYAHYLKLIDANYKEIAVNLLKKYGFEDKHFNYPAKKMIAIMQTDKKAEDNTIKIILPTLKGYVKECDLDTEVAIKSGLL